MTDKQLTIKLDSKLYVLILIALILVTLITFKDSITPASADYHEDSAQQVLVIELGDNTINKITKVMVNQNIWENQNSGFNWGIPPASALIAIRLELKSAYK